MAEHRIVIVAGDFPLTQEAAAILAGVTVQSIIRWDKQDNPAPRNSDGTYSAKGFGKWLMEQRSSKRVGAPKKNRDDDDGEGQAQAERRLTIAKADKADRENKVAEGLLLPVEEVESSWQTILSRVRGRVLKIPSSVAPLVVGDPDAHSIQSKIKDAVYDALTELSDNWRDGVEPDE